MTYEIKACSNQGMADFYGIPYMTWLYWLKAFRKKYPDIGKPVRGLWQPAQVKRFIDHIGPPSYKITEPE